MYLNRENTVEAICELLDKAYKEVVFITPYLKVSSAIGKAIRRNSERGITIFIIIRDENLEKAKNEVKRFDNVIVFAHPNVHAKCYYNEYNVIITSMNLYASTEGENREIGTIMGHGYIFSKLAEETKTLINSSTSYITSNDTSGLNTIKMFEPYDKRIEKTLILANDVFNNKIFRQTRSNDINRLNLKHYFPDFYCGNYHEAYHLFLEFDVSNHLTTFDVKFQRSLIYFDIKYLRLDKFVSTLTEILWDEELNLNIYQTYDDNFIKAYLTKKVYPETMSVEECLLALKKELVVFNKQVERAIKLVK